MLVPTLLAGLAAACGSTSVTDITAPDPVRCSASVTADPVRLPPDGGIVTVTVSAERECEWSARSDASWLTVRNAAGQGNGTFTGTAASYDGTTPRTATLTVNTQRVTVTQEPRPCEFTVQGPPAPLDAAGGTITVRVTTRAGCAWTASSSAPWLTVRTPSGTGTGDVRLDVEPNAGALREASVTIASQRVTIAQAAFQAAPVCSYAIDSPGGHFPASGGQGIVTVTTEPGCTWTADTLDGWITLLTASGAGTRQVHYVVEPNPDAQARHAALTIAGRVHTVTQDGQPCTYGVTPASRRVSASGGRGSVNVSTRDACAWTATSNAGWIEVIPAERSGPGTLEYHVQPNTLAVERQGTISVAGAVHTVTQDAAAPPCTYTLQPERHEVAASATTAAITVTTGPGCAWQAASTVPWIVVSREQGTGTAEISYTVTQNTTTERRTGAIVVAGQTHTVSQAGAAPECAYVLDPAGRRVGPEATQQTLNLTTGPGCAWTAVSTVPWISIASPSAAGSGPATLSYNVAANPEPNERSGSVVVAGQTHVVTQSALAPACEYALLPPQTVFSAAGGPGSVQVQTGATCTWTASSSANWVVITNPSGTGTGTIAYQVSPAPAAGDRVATITVNGRTHTVVQRGEADDVATPQN